MTGGAAGAAVRVAGAAAVLGAATRVARGRTPSWEERLFVALNSPPDWIEPVLWPTMQLGSLFGPPIVAGGLLATGRRGRPVAGALVAGVAAWQAAKAVKARVRRGRPHEVVATFARRAGTPYEGCGFVSGHSAVAAALATVTAAELPRSLRSAPFLVAATVGYARIHVSAHLPLDVVGGAALGYGIGWTWHFATSTTATSSAS